MHGYSDGCANCSHIQRFGKVIPGGHHSTACRSRLIEAIGQTDEGKKRLEGYKTRVDHDTADEAEKVGIERFPKAMSNLDLETGSKRPTMDSKEPSTLGRRNFEAHSQEMLNVLHYSSVAHKAHSFMLWPLRLELPAHTCKDW